MDDCIFCKMIRGDIESVRFWEDGEFLAILDNYPNTWGMALVLTKQHHPSYVFDMPDDVYVGLMGAARTVAKLLDRKLRVQRTAMVMEGLGIDHAHIKLYPLHGLSSKFEEAWAKERVFFDKYEGYVTTQLGPKADRAELDRLAKKLREP